MPDHHDGNGEGDAVAVVSSRPVMVPFGVVGVGTAALYVDAADGRYIQGKVALDILPGKAGSGGQARRSGRGVPDGRYTQVAQAGVHLSVSEYVTTSRSLTG